jgi:hypothetical protein
MSPRALVIAGLCLAILILARPLIASGIDSFKTFLSLQTLLNPCDGAGSPPPCRN